jgi:hypothetical protein
MDYNGAKDVGFNAPFLVTEKGNAWQGFGCDRTTIAALFNFSTIYIIIVLEQTHGRHFTTSIL